MRLNTVRIRAVLTGAIIFLVLLFDQIIKFQVKTNLLLHERIEVTNWFHILFTENRGMAFGMDFIGTTFLTLFRFAAVILFSVILVRTLRNTRYPVGLVICLSLVVAGAAGNIVDNCFYGLIFSESPEYSSFFATGMPAVLVPFGEGYGGFLSGRVVDMFYFPLFVWPEWIPFVGGEYFFNAIFNFADAAISCGAIALFLFYRKYINGEMLKLHSK